MRARFGRAARRLGLLALPFALAAPALLAGAGAAQVRTRTNPRTNPPEPVRRVTPRAAVAPKSAPTPRAGLQLPASPTKIRPVSAATVDFRQLAAQQAKAARLAPRQFATTLRTVHPPQTIREVAPRGEATAKAGARSYSAQADAGAPAESSPAPSQNFLAQEDGPKVGTGSFTIPPDTVGAVGLDKVFTNTNSNYRVHNKATGAPLSTVSMESFWAPTGAINSFDPKIVYDPYNNRWILAAASNPETADASLLVGLSDTSDPQGTYHLYRFTVEGLTGVNTNWADFPMLGFNKNWVAVSANLFTNSFDFFVEARVLILDYPALRANTVNSFTTEGIPAEEGGFCLYPATTLSATEPNLYMVAHLDSASAEYRVVYLTGTNDSPSLNASDIKTRAVNGQVGWTQPGGDILPQTCGPAGLTCPATLRFIDVGDAFIRSNVVFRSGRIYYPQTVGIGAAPGGPLTHTAAQWTALDSASFDAVDGGRVEDATATSSNGGRWYAYPSITVNKSGAVMLGFSEFESDDFADAGYAFRLASDAAGTMRDPVIYKEGEDYYEKTFSGPRNRWGDYSHTVVDPSNDRDMWTIQEYAATRVGAGTGINDSRWGTWWAKVTAPAGAGELVISEFRLRGPGGASDEFVEIYNASGSDLTVATADGSAGYAVAASDGATRCTIPAGTTIPNKGHFLCVNSVGYSLASYPAGLGTTATGDATYTADIPDNAGIALFGTANPANFSASTRLDAVGSTSEGNPLYREGTGYPALSPSAIDYSLFRDACGKGGSTTVLGACTDALVKDTDNNSADFVFVDTGANPTNAGQRLGAPGPENLSGPVERTNFFTGTNIDPAVGSANPPNRVRVFTSDPANNSSFGTLSIRKTITNNTGASVTRLRFRIVDITTFPVPTGIADLRPRSSGAVVVSIAGPNAACPGNVCTVQGTTREQPPAQGIGAGFNSSLSAGTVTMASPLANGASINVQFLLGIQQTGTFKFFINVEVLP